MCSKLTRKTPEPSHQCYLDGALADNLHLSTLSMVWLVYSLSVMADFTRDVTPMSLKTEKALKNFIS